MINKKKTIYKYSKFFFLVTWLVSINFVIPNNSTTCNKMYLENLTQENCFNSTACCYLEYQFYEQNFTKCIMKINDTEDLCPSIIDYSGIQKVNVITCNCNSFTIYFNIILLFGFIIICLFYL